jgi:hypothetical protein
MLSNSHSYLQAQLAARQQYIGPIDTGLGQPEPVVKNNDLELELAVDVDATESLA